LCRDLPALWAHPAVIDRERKDILALLIEDVTLLRECAEISAQVRLGGGACRSVTITRSRATPGNKTAPELVTRIEQLLEFGDDAKVAARLNAEHVRNWRNAAFTKSQITNVRRGHGLRSHRARRCAQGYEPVGLLAARYHVTRTTIRLWAKNGLLERSSCGPQHRWYYRLPYGTAIVKGNGGPYARPPRIVPAP